MTFVLVDESNSGSYAKCEHGKERNSGVVEQGLVR